MKIIEISPTPDMLSRYGSIPMRIEVRSELRVEILDGGLSGLALSEHPVAQPYVKDYDEDGGRPQDWAREFDISNWGFFFAFHPDDILAGAAAVAYNTNGVHMLEGRADMGVLWDIRVDPAQVRRGVGRALVDHAISWLRQRNCIRLKIETQNVNVNACRFYQALGCELGCISRFAYHEPHLAHEVMLLWYLTL
jgi:GNAT superfamily N-acetyltransferase